MSWKKTITKKGLSVLAGLDDDKVKVVSAWAGTGVVDSDNLHEQTSLVNPKQSLPIIEDAKLENKRILRLQVSNKDLQVKYSLNQLGVFISVNGASPILYYLAQNDDGDDIPAHDSAPGFLSEYIVTLVFTYGTDPEIDCPEIGFITPDALDARISSLKTELASEYGGTIPISATQPADWKDGDWWYEEINESAPDPPIPVEVQTVPYDSTKMFHMGIDGTNETLLQVTDDETTATPEDLILS